MILTTVVLNVPSAPFSATTPPVPPANIPVDPVLQLNAAHLFSFLQQYQEVCPNLQMPIPLSGAPSIIDIQFASSPGFSAKMILSPGLSYALTQYVLQPEPMW
jgi:hypothetical protein